MDDGDSPEVAEWTRKVIEASEAFMTNAKECTLDDLEYALPNLVACLESPDHIAEYGKENCERCVEAVISVLHMQISSDREAELVHRGYLMGVSLAWGMANKGVFNSVLSELRQKGQKVRAKKNAERNKEIAERYRELTRHVDCLCARRRIRDEYLRPDGERFSMVQIKNILRSEGINISKKKI